MKMLKRLLVAFDFDHTIINKNSDVVVQDLIPNEEIPADVKVLYCSDGWTTYMQRIFQTLHSKGITPEQIQSAVRNIPVTPGIDTLITLLHSYSSEMIIISDSNSEFINEWLVESSLKNAISQVFTNPASYNSNGCLEIEMYHCQDWCELSTQNLCKGHILETYIQERAKQGITFSKVAYVGDGKNDLCPCLRLSENDMAFARIGYALINCIKTGKNENKYKCKAAVYPWTTGSDIIDIINKYV